MIPLSDQGSQYVSIRYSERLAEAGIDPSIGSKGDRYDASAESINWFVQVRNDSPASALENQGICRAGNAGMGALV